MTSGPLPAVAGPAAHSCEWADALDAMDCWVELAYRYYAPGRPPHLPDVPFPKSLAGRARATQRRIELVMPVLVSRREEARSRLGALALIVDHGGVSA